MPETNWGRKETIIWPPHQPIYTIGALLLALIATGLFVYLRFQFGLSPLQQLLPSVLLSHRDGGHHTSGQQVSVGLCFRRRNGGPSRA